MKKFLALALSSVLALSLLAGCGSSNTPAASGSSGSAGSASTGETVTLKVGASITPHAEILNQCKPILAEQGIDLEVVEYTDYVQPNTALEEGSLDANYFQHINYLNWFNGEYNTHLVSAASVHYEPFGIYAGKVSAIADLKDGDEIDIPNDGSNETRALLLLQQEGLIKLADGAGITATAKDIVENPKNLQIKELEAANIPNALKDVDIACINGNYAQAAGLSVEKDALAVEATDSLAAETYANVLVVKDGNQDSEKTQALAKALKSDAVRDFINKTYEGAVVPVF